jgi:CheY-like chemotaxis protein
MISTENMAKRILIADDSVTIQKAFAMTFAGADDVTLTSARSADEGLAIAQKVQPDLVIADGVMPGRSGYDLCASIRSDPQLRAVPVFILASVQQPYDDGKGQRSGATGHFQKPWETNALLDKVREALRGGAGAPAAAVPAAVGHAPSQRTAASLPTAAIEDDEYGEISIDGTRDTDDQRARVATPPPVDPRARVATPPPPPAPHPGRISSPSMPAYNPAAAMSHAPAPHAAATPPAPGSGLAMRPSLIPGMRPGAVPPARPGTVPVRPTATAMPAATAAPAMTPPRPAGPPQIGRTMIGLPATNVPIPGVMRPAAPAPAAPMPPAAPMRSPTAPVAPLAPARPPSGPQAPLARGPAPAPHAPLGPAISASVDQRLAAFAAKGPEYEAIAKLSREIIEQIAWEVVPELAEAIIRAEVEKRRIQ